MNTLIGTYGSSNTRYSFSKGICRIPGTNILYTVLLEKPGSYYVPHLFKSTDNGNTWNDLGVFGSGTSNNWQNVSLAVDPLTNNVHIVICYSYTAYNYYFLYSHNTSSWLCGSGTTNGIQLNSSQPQSIAVDSYGNAWIYDYGKMYWFPKGNPNGYKTVTLNGSALNMAGNILFNPYHNNLVVVFQNGTRTASFQVFTPDSITNPTTCTVQTAVSMFVTVGTSNYALFDGVITSDGYLTAAWGEYSGTTFGMAKYDTTNGSKVSTYSTNNTPSSYNNTNNLALYTPDGNDVFAFSDLDDATFDIYVSKNGGAWAALGTSSTSGGAVSWTIAKGFPEAGAYCPNMDIVMNSYNSAALTNTYYCNPVPTAPGSVTTPSTVNTTATIQWTNATCEELSHSVPASAPSVTSSAGIQDVSGATVALAQVFTTPALPGLALSQVSWEGYANTIPAYVTYSIWTVSGGVPSTKLWDSGTITINSSTDEWFAYSVPYLQLQPNTNYAFVITSTGTNAVTVRTVSTNAAGISGKYMSQTYGNPGTWTGSSTYFLQIQTQFTAISSALTYHVDLSLDNGSTWANIESQSSAGATSFNYDFTNQAQSTTAMVRVRAGDGFFNGAYLNSAVFTIQHNTAPNAPTHANISNLGCSYNKRPKFFVNVSDPDSGNTIQNVEMQIASDSGFATIVKDVQYGSDSGYGTATAGWGGLPTTTNSATMINWTPQADLPVQTLYIRVRSKDNNGAWSAWSATQTFTIAAVLWNDTPAGYGMKAQWMNDLATAINNVRQFRGLATATFTDGTIAAQDANGNGTDIKATHITERRTKITDVYNVVGGAPTWTNATIDNTKDRSGQDIIDLRNAVTAA